MINLFWSGLLTVFLLSGCGWSGTPTRPNDFSPLTSITISAASPTIADNTSIRLTATGHYSSQFSRDVTAQVVWLSDTPSVAGFITTAHPNRVTGVAPGTAIVTATMGGVSAVYTLTVSNATIQTMTITPAAPVIAKGLETQFAATGSFLDGGVTTTQDLTYDAVWASVPGTVATVSNDPASRGRATALAIGDETITATFGATSGSATLTVSAAVLQSISVTPANSTIAGSAKTATFTAAGNYSDGTTADITTLVAWTSSLGGVATIVASSGVATTVAAGTTLITATLGSISGKTNLTVTSLVLSAGGLKITPVSQTLGIGSTQQLTLTATFTNGTSQNVAATSSWVSSSIAVATVSTAGLVTGVSTGSTTISGTYGGQTATAIVTVP